METTVLPLHLLELIDQEHLQLKSPFTVNTLLSPPPLSLSLPLSLPPSLSLPLSLSPPPSLSLSLSIYKRYYLSIAHYFSDHEISLEMKLKVDNQWHQQSR